MTATSRRDFLRATTLTSALFGVSAGAEETATRTAAANSGSAARVIFMVSDGMNHGALSLAHHFLAMREEGRLTNWMQLYRERPVVRALMETVSANSIVTDSAAAASSWGGGRRVPNGSLNVAADGSPSETIQAILRAKGIPTGLVTTATVTHATPAGFAAVQSDRGKEEDIAQQYLDAEVPVLLGGGEKFFPEDRIAAYRKKGYEFVRTKAELGAVSAGSGRLLGTFASGYLPFEIDRRNVPGAADEIPSLAAMAQAAVHRLESMADGRFFLMVEGARIDHAGHANDAAASIHDQLAFDEAVGVMARYAADHPGTLLIITTDHGCGGIQMNGVSVKPNQEIAPGIYNGSTAAFRRIAGFKRSFEWMKREGGGLNGPPLADFVREHTGLSLEGDDLAGVAGLKSAPAVFGKYHGIGWSSGNHTGDLVEFCATGAGSALFPPFVRNDEVRGLILRAMEVS